jgi:hypothetical protein
MRWILWLLVVCMSVVSCHLKDKYPPEVEAVLDLAGDNRGELEKVLTHYSSGAKDSLKLRAAYYLIAHMGDAYYLKSTVFESFSEVFSALDSYGDKLLLSANQLKNKEIRRSKYEELWAIHERKVGDPGKSDFIFYEDLKTITADVLIENIDYAFKAWGFAWAKHYQFEDFCRYILPYRCHDEPLEPWRGYYFEKLSPVLDSLRNETDPLVVAKAINEWISIDFWYCDNLKMFKRGALKPNDLLRGRIAALCTDQVVLGNSIMRAAGIAASSMMIPTWGTISDGHEVTAILSKSGKWHYLEIGDGLILDATSKLRAPKLFLRTQNGDYPNLPDAATGLSFTYLNGYTDVTDQFNDATDLTVALPEGTSAPYVYLCTFSSPGWSPVYFAKVSNRKATFEKMGRGMVYLPAISSKSGKLSQLAPPIWVDNTGRVTSLSHQSDTLSYTFYRKFNSNRSEGKIARSKALKGGKFQAANQPDFSDAVDLLTVGSFVSYHPQLKPVKPLEARYVRYVFPKAQLDIKDGPALLAFYGSNGQLSTKLTGKFMASKGVTEQNLNRLFDDDLLTYVSYTKAEPHLDVDLDEIIVDRSENQALWVGIDLGKRQKITQVAYCPRNDKNEVYRGNRYELFYWDKQWRSLGVKTAQDTFVHFGNIPSKALLRLKNLNEGKEERIFTVLNNQIQWH